MAVLSAEEKAQRNRDTAALLAKINEVTGTRNTAQTMQTEFFKKAGVNIGINSKTNAVTIDGKSVKDYQYRKEPLGAESSTNLRKTDMQKKKEDRAEEKWKVDSLQTKKNQAQKALDDFDNNKEIDWTDTNQRKAYDAERKRLQDEVDRAGAEIDARKDAATHDANMERIASMNAEDREQLQQYVESRDARRSVFANPISWYQDYNKETENKNALIDKYGEKEFDKLAETYSRQLHEQNAKKTVEDTQESVNQNWIAAALHNIAAVPARAMGGIEAMAGRLYEQADRTGQYRTLEENTAGDTLSLYGNAVSGQTAQNIAGENGNVVRGALSLGYQGIMSIADSIARTFFGGGAAGSAALAATNSFTQTVSEATKQGASPQQAVSLGVAKAGMEYITEKIPMDEVFKVAKAGDVKVIEQAFKQMGIEITTEELTLFGFMAAEAAILREKSSYKQKIGELVANGKSYEEAKALADNDVWNEVLQTAAVSGFAGFLSGSGAAIVGNLATNNAPEVTTEAPQEVPAEVAPAQQAAPNVSDIVADMVQKNNQQKQEQETSIEVPSGETKEQKRYDWENIFDEWEDDDEGGLWEYFQETKNIETPVQEQKKQDVFDVIADMVQENFVKQNEQERAKPNVSDIVADMLRKSTEAQQQEQAKATQPATPQQTVPVQKPVQPAEIPGANTFIKKDEPPKGKKIYLEYQSISPASSFFHPKEPSNFKGSDELNFTVNADGTLNWDQSKIDESYNTVGGYISKGFGYLYDMYVDGKKVTDANSDTFSGYYDMKKADVQIKPVLREISGGNFILSQKGELNLYSDNFVKPTQTAQQPAVTAEQAQPVTQPQQTAPVQETPVTAQKATPEPVAAEPAPKQEEAPKANEKVAAAQQKVEEDEKKTQVRQAIADGMKNVGAQKAQKNTAENIKGTGAAEANFTGKAAYQDLLTEENTQRDRPGDVRPMEVPKTDSFGKRVSELVGNAYGAEITTDKMANAIEELVQDGSLGFDVRHNQDSINKAAEQIAQRGVAATKKQITNAVASGKIRDGDVEQAILLYAMYNSKDTPTAIDNASEILVDLATMANITGRNLQMFRLLRKMTPEGQVSTIRKTVQRNIDSMIKSGAVKKGYTTEIDPELLAEYRKAAGEHMRAVSEEQKKASAEKMKTIMDAIYAMEAAKMPATMKAKWDAWRYMSMIGNAKTQVRNVAGNIAFIPYKTVKDKMGAAFEKMLPKEQRTKALVNDPELVRWADADAKSENVKDALKYSGKLGDDVAAEKMRDNMKVFDTKALEAVRKFVEKVPQAGDMAFKSKYYSHSLAGFLKARGYTVSDIQSDKVSDAILSEARSYAIQEAMKATFNDSNAFSDFMATGLRYKGDNPIGKALNTAAEGVLPFRRTPANIAVRFTEYSPVGMAKGVWDMATKVRKGEISAAAAVDQITAGMTGTAAMALGYFLANGIAGVKITGSGTGEDEKRQGHQDYALEWTDKDGQEYSYRIDWAAPANLPLFVGANINKLITDQGGDTSVSKFTSTLHGIMTMFEPMLALSCLSSLNDLVEGIRYADEGEALYTAAADIATSYIMQGIPSLVRQTAQAKQEFKQATFANSDDPTLRDMQSTAANIPFVGEKYQTDKVNAWGEKESTGTKGERIFNAFINPGTYKKIDNSALEKEVSRLNKSQDANVAPFYIPKVISYTDKDGNKHNNHRMTEEEYQTLAQTQGQTAKSILESMISSKNYAAMTDDQRAKAMQQVYSYAREKAMQKAFPDHLGYSESWMQELREGKEADYILRRVTNSELNRTMSNLTTAWDNKYSSGVTDSYSRELETAYDSYSKMDAPQKRQVKEFATGNAAKYIEAREKGISHADFITTARNVNNVKGTGKSGTVRDIDRRQAIAKTAGLTPAEVDKLMRVYMPDYDKTDESPETTEFKYQYIREELDLSPAEYASTYKAYLDGEKKAGKIADIMKLGYDYKTANAIYKVHRGSMKQKLIAMYG